MKLNQFITSKVGKWCSREDLNLHGSPHTILSRTRLPFRHVSAVYLYLSKPFRMQICFWACAGILEAPPYFNV